MCGGSRWARRRSIPSTGCAAPGRRHPGGTAAHPNARFTAPASPMPGDRQGMGRPQGRADRRHPVRRPPRHRGAARHRSLNWLHGTFLGSIMASEKTAAASGVKGDIRRDPMAMLPFCGYHMGDYFAHWLKMGEKGGAKMPKIFYVNWFRKNKRRQVHVARLCREQPRAEMDLRALRRQGQGRRYADRQGSGRRRDRRQGREGRSRRHEGA